MHCTMHCTAMLYQYSNPILHVLTMIYLHIDSHFRKEQCAEGVVTLVENDKLNGEAMVISPRKGNFLHDKTRELEYAKVL